MGEVFKYMKKISVTVGIPAYNEEKNIENILNDILFQDKNSFVLKKIYVSSDGSTDETSKIVKRFVKKYDFITLLDNKEKLGKSTRLNELYKLSNTDIYINFDADQKLGDKFVIEEIIKKFNKSKVGVVGASSLPMKPKKFFEKIVVAWINVWISVREDYKKGNTIHNHLGCASAMRKNIYKNINLPKNLIADEDYIYFSAMKMGYDFRFAKNARVYYKSASNINDFFIQHSRFLMIKDIVAEHFGSWVLDYYIIPKKYKINSLLKNLIRNPIYLSFSIVLQMLLVIYKKLNNENYNSGKWKEVKTSKVLI